MCDELEWASAPLKRIRAADKLDCQTAVLQVLQIPVVDLSQSDAEAAFTMRNACEKYGFFYVASHGMSQALIDKQFAASKAFFALPLSTKLKLKVDQGNRGYYPFGMGSAKNPFAQEDRKEAFNAYGFETESGDVTPFHGVNKWPSEHELPGFRQTMEEYYQGMSAVANRLVTLLAMALDLPASFFEERFSRPVANIRAVHYVEGQPSNPEAGIFGVGPHTDWGALTILATDNEPGLQICVGKTWIDVEPRPGMFVVNLGDMVDRWTNGRFKSTLHRVVNSNERFSTPFFLAANWDAEMSVLPQCAVAGESSPAAPATCGAWLTMRRRAEYEKRVRNLEDTGSPTARPVSNACSLPHVAAQ